MSSSSYGSGPLKNCKSLPKEMNRRKGKEKKFFIYNKNCE